MAISLTINEKTCPAVPGRTLFDLAEEQQIRVPTSCRKQGKCKECLVEVTEGSELLSPPSPAEAHLRDRFRLSCCCTIAGESGRIECHTMRRGRLRIEAHGSGLPAAAGEIPLDPIVKRDGDWILLAGEPIERSEKAAHGLAVDLGTTTVVLRLYNLETGELVADTSFENPQRFAGTDVMARIHYDTQHKGHLLMRTLAGYLTHAIEDLPVEPTSIYDFVVAANSTMRDVFFRKDVYSIGQSPYQSITEMELARGERLTTTLVASSKECMLPIHPRARVCGLPIISGHVGADAAACMLAINLANENRLVALMDIGTNTELILGNRQRILAASCPAGPAFEGGAITCGMPGLAGAIEDVKINQNGCFELGVIGDGPPLGICGSGLVDLLSELLRTGKMNELGRFTEATDRYLLEQATAVQFRESDVNELAQAKGANVAGLQIVFANYGIRFDEVDCFYLAGGFGRHLKVEASQRIGLIPDIDASKIVQVGNAAIEGASIALLSRSKLQELEALVKRVEHCRLETHPDFFDFFVEGCQFKPVRSFPTASV